MENKVIKINKDDKFFFKKGSAFLREGKIPQAINYLLKARKSCLGGEIYLLYFMLAQAYFFNKNYELSNLYYFLSLKEELISQSVFRGLGENFIVQNDIILARYYLNQCANFGKTIVGQSAKDRLKTLENEEPQFVVIDGEKSDTITLENAREKMSEGKFADAILLYEKHGDFSAQDVRSELALAYFFESDFEKTLSLLHTFGTDSVSDLCNLLLVHHASNDAENYQKTKEKLRVKRPICEEDKFKIALTLAQTHSLDLALVYMEDYLAKNTADIELEFYYIIALMNDRQFEKAKRLLINLKRLNPLDNHLFNHYLALCSAQDKRPLEYIFSLPLREMVKMHSRVKTHLVRSAEELKKSFLENADFFLHYALKTPHSNTKTMLLMKLASLEGEEFENFFDILLLGDRIKTSLKIALAAKRAALDSTVIVALTRENVYSKIILPNMQVTKINNLHLHAATQKVVNYLLSELPPISVSLARNVVKIERRIKADNVRSDVLACFLSYESLKNFRITTLNKICRHFKVLQQEFYKFLDDYNFEI